MKLSPACLIPALMFLVWPGLADERDPADLLRPPLILPDAAPALAPLLPAPATMEEWEQRRAGLKREWIRVLGAFPTVKAALEPEFQAREELPAFTRQRVSYQIEEGIRTDAMLLIPKGTPGPLAGIVLFHPTYAEHYHRVAGLTAGADPELEQAVQLAAHGYAVLCPRCFLWEDIPGESPPSSGPALYMANVKRLRERHPDWKGITRMTWDGIRAIDFLGTVPEVDSRRIGIFGHSLGAKTVLYVAAFDERVKCAVLSEGGIGLNFSNWEDVWYLGPQAKQPGFGRDHHELLAMIAPRPFLLLAGESADGDRSWRYMEAALPVYQLFGNPPKLGWYHHRMGHRYPPEARRIAERFLDHALRN